MKRFTETEKWRDPWFRQLPAPSKLVFYYFLDNCNNAGFHELDKDLMVILTGMKPEHCDGALQGLSRGIIGPCDGWYWVRRFLRHQKNENLNPDNPAHKQILALVGDQIERFRDCAEFQAFLAPLKGLLRPIGIGTGTGKKGSAEGKQKPGPIPTREQAVEYGKEIGMSEEDVNGWFDHFQSNGWKISGRTPMRDWQAALRNGKRRGNSINGSKPVKPPEKVKWVG